MEVTFDSDTATNGLSELTTRQSSNPKNYGLLYGFDTMLREKEILRFSLIYKGGVTYIFIL